MARYVDAIDLSIPIEEAFDYLADFSRTAEWDPGVLEAEQLTPGEVQLGSRFRVSVSFLGRRIPLEYRMTEFSRPSRLVLTGGDDSLCSVDEITFVSRRGGTRVTYEARVELAGLRRIADPLLDLLLQRVGRLAVRGLRERLAGEPEPRRPGQLGSLSKLQPDPSSGPRHGAGAQPFSRPSMCMRASFMPSRTRTAGGRR